MDTHHWLSLCIIKELPQPAVNTAGRAQQATRTGDWDTLQSTCVSSRPSRKFELDGLQWKQKLNCHCGVENQFFSSWNHIFGSLIFKTLTIHISSMVTAFDLIPRLKARLKYQLSSGTRRPHISLLYLVWLRFLSESIPLGYAQLWWATFNHSQSGYSVMLKNTKHIQKLHVLAIWKHFRKSKLLHNI